MATSVTAGPVDIILKTLTGASRSLREINKVDPRRRYVALFPHSCAAHVGMAFHILTNPTAEKLIDEASQIVHKDVMRLCIGDSARELNESLENRNIAAFVTSHATITKLGIEKPMIVELCKSVGGIGLGLINCLVFSESMSFENGLDLAQRIGQAMDRASEIVPGNRIKIQLRPATQIDKVCRAAQEHCLKIGIPKEIAVCSMTHKWLPNFVEMSGHPEAIDFLEKRGEDLFQFRRCFRNEARQNASHSPLMAPAGQFISDYIEDRLKRNPEYIKAPVTSSVFSSTSGLRLRLVEQVIQDLKNFPTKPILQENLLNTMFQRPTSVAQPNILVIWDKKLLRNLGQVNGKARRSARLLK